MSTPNKEGQTAFVFPDEVAGEEVEVGVGADAGDKLEVVVEDDTPPEDRNRRPMTDQPVEPTEEELASYSESVRSRFKHFTKGLHEERRAKETGRATSAARRGYTGKGVTCHDLNQPRRRPRRTARRATRRADHPAVRSTQSRRRCRYSFTRHRDAGAIRMASRPLRPGSPPPTDEPGSLPPQPGEPAPPPPDPVVA